MSGATDHVILSEDLYKQTVAFDYVVKRHVRLYSNRFETFADISDAGHHRTFELDASARLQPDRKDAIQQKRRYLRPPGVGSMTALAAVRGKGALLDLVGAVQLSHIFVALCHGMSCTASFTHVLMPPGRAKSFWVSSVDSMGNSCNIQ